MTATPVTPRSDFDLVRAALAAEYEVIEEIGRGGMAIVYRAVERAAGREVAVKVLPAQFAFDESFVERFQREGRIAAQLEHPYIVPVHRVGRSGHVIYFAMKLLRGESLGGRLRLSHRLPAADTRRMLLEVASALGYAAARGVIHRDVKPDNIMFDDDGRCVVADFGIARSAAESKLTATGMSVGTPRYMSPEQARSKPLDGRSDIYSLGIVGYECLVGDTPFHGDDAFAVLMAHIRSPLPRPALGSAEEWDLFDVVERMLAKDPDDRFQSADELIAALGGVRSDTGRRVAYSPGAVPVAATRPTRAVRDQPSEPAGDVDTSGPRPSAALDRALEVGVHLLKQQKPKLDAGLRALKSQKPRLDAGLSAIKAQQPKVQAGLAAGRQLALEQQPRVAAVRQRVTGAVVTGIGYVRSRTRRFWMGSAAALASLIVGYYGVHFATRHRTRCPVGTLAADSAHGGAAKARTFSVLMDAVGSQSAGNNLDVYYDVCGLDAGTTYTANVRVEQNSSGFRRLLGRSPGPITATYDEEANGPAVRRHRTLVFGDMPPGSYSLDLVVTDARGRVRAKSTAFQVER